MADVGRRRQAARGTERRGDRAVDEHAPRPRASTATSVAVGHRRSARGRLLLPPPGAEPCRAGGVSEALAPIAVETTPDLGTARAAPACRCQARPAGRPIGADTGSRDRLTHSRGGYAGRGRGSGPLSRRRRAGRRKGSWACRKSDSCASRKEDLQTTRQLQLAGAEDRPAALLEHGRRPLWVSAGSPGFFISDPTSRCGASRAFHVVSCPPLERGWMGAGPGGGGAMRLPPRRGPLDPAQQRGCGTARASQAAP